uniref:Uncharacterized protein n=1 Tax=Ditylenchus dipsaci TaxID=166011 RepID=A0A915D3R2_9BILA
MLVVWTVIAFLPEDVGGATFRDWFLDEDQQAQPVGTPTGDDFSALFNVPIDDTFFGEATIFSQGSSVVVQPGQAPYQLMAQRLALQAIANPHSNKCKISNLRPCSHMIPANLLLPRSIQPSGQQLQQPYTSSTNLNHTSSTEFDLSAAAELAAAFENQRSDGLPSYERPMQSGTYVPECQPSTSSANQFGHMESSRAGWEVFKAWKWLEDCTERDGQQIAYVDQQQEMLTEMGGQYVNAAAQNEGGYNPVQVMHPHTNSTNMPPHILQQNQNQPSFHSMPPQTLISGSQPPPQLMSNGPDMLSTLITPVIKPSNASS